MRRAVARSTAMRLGARPVVELECSTRITSASGTRARGGLRLKTVTGRKGSSAIVPASSGATGQWRTTLA